MNTEDIMKLLSHSKIEVQGDFVVKKEVQFEVNNVEPGGVAFLIGDKEMTERLLANHTVGQLAAKPHQTEAAAAASRKTAASSQPIAEQPAVDQTSANSQWTGNDPMSHPTESTHPTGKDASHPTPQYRALFIRNDGSSAENREVREQEQKRFMKYLKNYRLTNHVLTCASDNPLNDVVTGFVLKWINRKLIHSNPTGTAIFRFLTVDCGLQSEVSDRSYGNKIMTRIKLRHCSNKTRDNINLYFD